MEDQAIVALYFQRAEQAIAETIQKYGSLCRSIAQNLLPVRQDAEECVNDTWQAAWERIPPQQPRVLSAFLGRITRNLAISRFRKNTAKRRDAGIGVLLSELEEIEFILDRPFLFVITNRVALPLFVGIVNQL